MNCKLYIVPVMIALFSPFSSLRARLCSALRLFVQSFLYSIFPPPKFPFTRCFWLILRLIRVCCILLRMADMQIMLVFLSLLLLFLFACIHLMNSSNQTNKEYQRKPNHKTITISLLFLSIFFISMEFLLDE